MEIKSKVVSRRNVAYTVWGENNAKTFPFRYHTINEFDFFLKFFANVFEFCL